MLRWREVQLETKPSLYLFFNSVFLFLSFFVSFFFVVVVFYLYIFIFCFDGECSRVTIQPASAEEEERHRARGAPSRRSFAVLIRSVTARVKGRRSTHGRAPELRSKTIAYVYRAQ